MSSSHSRKSSLTSSAHNHLTNLTFNSAKPSVSFTRLPQIHRNASESSYASPSNSILSIPAFSALQSPSDITTLQSITAHLIHVRDTISLVLQSGVPREKVLHCVEKAPQRGVWKRYYADLDAESKMMQKENAALRDDHERLREVELAQLRSDHEKSRNAYAAELETLREENAKLLSQNVALHQEINHLSIKLATFTQRTFNSQGSQSSTLSVTEFEKISTELHLLKNKHVVSCGVDATVATIHRGTGTARRSTCESFVQATATMAHASVDHSKRMVHQQVQHAHGRMVDKCVGKVQMTDHRHITCLLLDHNKVKHTEEKLRQTIHQLTHIPKSSVGVEANIQHETEDAMIECTLQEESRHWTLENCTKSVQNAATTSDCSVSCAPEMCHATIHVAPESLELGLQVKVSMEHKRIGAEPETWDSSMQFRSEAYDQATQHEPESYSVQVDTHVPTRDKGMVCIVFTEEIACQCDLLTKPILDANVKLSQEFTEEEPETPMSSTTTTLGTSAAKPKSKKPQAHTTQQILNKIGKKRKAKPTFCELCNIHFSSTDELQLHQEACHTKRQRTHEEEEDTVHTTEECDICMLELFDGNPMYRLRNCSHYFHLHCVYRCLLSRSIPNRCVRCFTDIPDTEMERIESLVKKADRAKSRSKKTYEDYTIYEFD